MKTHGTSILAGLFLAAAAAQASVSIEMVPVGDIGNASDPTTEYGSVGYSYNIGKYEVSIGQYTAYLNSVAKTDPNGLYNSAMGTNLDVAGISQSGTSGTFAYAVMDNGGDSSNRPISNVSWFDAARFANWLANGQPVGEQGNATTEDGGYTLNGAKWANEAASITRNVTNPNNGKPVTWWIPSEDEWYKAAYYDPTKGGIGGYWLYPTQSDTEPGNTIGSGANQANGRIRGHNSTGAAPYITNGGAYSGSASHYGTFDQAGNVHEWEDDALIELDYTMGMRGGSWRDPSSYQRSSCRKEYPGVESPYTGFRVACRPDRAVPFEKH